MSTLAAEPWIDLRTLLAVTQVTDLQRQVARRHVLRRELEAGAHAAPASRLRAASYDLLRALPKGDPAAAFETAYGKSLDVVERDLHAYLSGGTINT